MTKILDDYSRFSRTEMIIVDNNETFGVWKTYSFLKQRPRDEDIGVFQVTNDLEGRPDLISFRIYGTPLLDWVLISFNSAGRNVLNWPRAGDIIEYPVESIVIPEVLQ